MRLIYCINCKDVVALHSHGRACLCGKSSGQYLDDNHHIVVRGPCKALAFGDLSFQEGLKFLDADENGIAEANTFTAFFISDDDRSVTRNP